MNRHLAFFGFTVCAGLALLGAWPAAAADQALKAPVVRASAFEGAGFYVGLGSLAATTNATLALPDAGATGTVTTAGAGLGPVVGYHKGTAAGFWEVEGAVYWMNLGGTQDVTLTAGSASARADFNAAGRFKLGGTNIIATLGRLLPGNLGLNDVFTPGAPAVGQSTLPYIAIGFDVTRLQSSVIGVDAQGYQVTPTVGMGFLTHVMDPVTSKPTGWVTDTSIEYTPPGRGVVMGGDGTANLGRKFMAKFSVLR